MLRSEIGIMRNSEDDQYQTVGSFEDLQEQAVGAGREVWEGSRKKQLLVGVGRQNQGEMLRCVQEEKVQTPLHRMGRDLT